MEIFKLFGSIFVDNDKANESLDDTDDKGRGLADTFGRMGGAAIAFGGILGGALVAGLGAAAAGVGSLFVTGQNLKGSLNDLKAQTGATADEMEDMEESLKNIYKNNYGDSFKDIGDALGYAKQVTKTTGEELQYLAQDALMLRDTFGFDVKESIKAADQIMKEFEVNGTTAMAMIAEATQKGLNRSDDLIDTIDEYSVYFDQAGLGAEEMFAMFENASAAGVRNLDYVGDAVKEFGIIMKEDSDRAKEALTSIGLPADKLISDFAKGGESGKAAFQTITQAVGQIEDPIKRNQVGVELFGTKFEDLEADAVAAMGNLEGTIKGSVDTLNEINEVKFDTIGEALRGIGRNILIDVVEPFEQRVMPTVNKFSDWAISKMPVVQGYIDSAFSFIDEKIKQFQPTIDETIQFLGMLKDNWITNFQTMWAVVSPLLDFILQKVMEVVSMIVDWWKTNGQELATNVQTVFNAIWGVIQFVMPAILLLVSSIFENIKGVISGALNIIMGIFQVFAGLLTGDWSRVWEGIKTLLAGALEFLWNLFNLMMIGKLLGGIKSFITSGLGWFQSFGTAVKGTFSDFINNVINLFGYFRATGSSIWSAITGSISNIVSGFVNAVKANFGQIWDDAVSIFNKVKDAITSPIQTAKNSVKGFIDEIKGFFNNLSLKLPDIKTPTFKIKNWSKNPVDWLKAMPTIDIDWYAKGTNYARGGLAIVGEQGPELMEVPRGAKIHTAAETRKMQDKGGNTYNINVHGNNVDIDEERLTRTLQRIELLYGR